ncbi:ABC transporter substrate-binding protein [Streptomyces sp. NPDC057636]|uniref:ABC transporter substrate-binding protein n=2 Tax=unclassified Streptomyces TaxID=2593676 RepID=UPI00369396F6
MKRTGSRLAAAVAVVAVAVASLSSCGDSGAASDSKSLTYWSMWTENEPQAAVLKSAIADFEKDTGIKVDVQWQGRTVLEKVAPTLITGKVPDLVDHTDDKLYPTLAQPGRARDLSGVLTGPATGEKEKLSETGVQRYMGHLRKSPDGVGTWMIPYEVLSVGLWYNGADKDVKAPATWDDLLDTCAALKKEKRACIAVDGDQGAYTAWWLDYLVDRIGGDGTMAEAIKDKTGAGWGDPAVKDAAAKVADLVDKGYLIKGYDASKYPEQQNRWAQGKAGFILNGSWLPAETGKFAAAGFDARFAPFPSVDGGKGGATTDVRLLGFCVPRQAKHADAAEKLISYFMAKKRLSGISETAANLTPRDDIDPPKGLTGVKATLESTEPREQLAASTPEFNEKVLFPAYQKLFFGKTDADGFVAEVKELHRAYVKAPG